jgi:6-phosphogluconolactonase
LTEHTSEIRRAVNGAEVAHLAAREIIETLEAQLLQKPEVHFALTGGTVGILTLATLAEQPDLERVDLSRVHFWWGDERFVASNSEDRNAIQARRVLFAKIQVSESNIHEFPSSDNSLELETAKTEFLIELRKHFGSAVLFDLVILGMGPDGHIASLFPGHESLADGQEVIAETNSPKLPAQRLSFSYSVLNSAKKIIFVVSGLDKASAVTDVHTNENSLLPAAKISALEETIWFVDQAAGADFWSC